MNYVRIIFVVIGSILLLGCKSKKSEEAEQILEIIHRVNNYWQTHNKPQQWSFWEWSAYHTGNMEAYFLTKEPSYLKYSEDWANHNQWKGAKSDNKEEWKYRYCKK